MVKKKKNNNLEKRPPVIVVLGHVDHGKSSLLEAIKDLKITGSESGGITQHIGAYAISHKGEDITFIDTPGHEAFSEMRSRGVKVADIGILVVAADEGVKEQTKEAIKNLKEIKIPYLVVINKIDKKDINIDRVKQELAKEDIIVESYGGKIPSVEVSAKKKKGIDELLEMIALLAEMEDIKSEKDAKGEGVIIEVKKDPQKGMVATFLVQKGSLRVGDIIGSEGFYGTIRNMEDFQGEEVEEAKVSMPVQVTGLKGVPKIGETFYNFKKISEAKKHASQEKSADEEKVKTLSDSKKNLNIILKVDVTGSLEAIEGAIAKIPQEKINIKIIKSEIGDITESDIETAKSSKSKILAFKIKGDKATERMAIREEIEVDNFDIIYELIEKVREMAKEKLDPVIEKEEKGKVKILAVFKTQKNRQILGGKVMKGELNKGDIFEIVRENKEVGEGKIINLKKEEKDIKKIPEGEEFGMLIESKEKIEEKDIIIPFKEKEIEAEL